MKNKIIKLVAKLMTFATIATSVMSVAPARAATPTLMKDTLSRLQISASATHSISMTLPGTGIIPATTGAIVLTYTDFGTFTGSGTATCGAGTATVTTSTNTVTITSGGTACSGTLTVTGLTNTNPGTAGSKTVSLTGNAANLASVNPITGSFAVAIVDSDQVSVTASVDPSLTFDLDTATTDTETAAPYTVPLGTLTTAAVNRSNDSSINGIWIDVSTNAGGGAIVTVQNANGASGLASTSVPADNINSATGTMAAGTENYGLCVSSTTGAPTQTTGGPFIDVAPFDGTCADAATNAVGGLTTTAQSILSTSTDPIAGGRAQIRVNAAISGTTVAHTDYADTLTFVATATF